MAKTATNVLDTLKALDVGEIDAELDNIQEQIAELQASADKLRAVRKAVDLAVNGKPPRAARGTKKKAAAKPSAPAPAGAIPSGLADRIRAYLVHSGPTSVGALATALGADPNAVSGACKANPHLFGWNPRGGGWQLRRPDDE